jgi:hypothetical protein
MKKLFIVNQTEKTEEEIRNSLNLKKLPFTLWSPYVVDGFSTETRSFYYRSTIFEDFGNAEFESRDGGSPLQGVCLPNWEDYEEFSEELNDWEENVENLVKEKTGLVWIENVKSLFYAYNNIPYYCVVQYSGYPNEDTIRRKEQPTESKLFYEIKFNL